MSNLGNRIAALARLRPAGKLVLVRPADPGEQPGIAPHPRGVTLTVPAEFDGDPTAGLTDAQRARIGRADSLVVLAYEDRSPEDPRP